MVYRARTHATRQSQIFPVASGNGESATISKTRMQQRDSLAGRQNQTYLYAVDLDG